MKILFIGDDITRGSIGVSWVNKIIQTYPGWQFENAGSNGDTLLKISERLIQKLEKDNTYDVIVLQAGYNDILLPEYKDRNYWFRKRLRTHTESGNLASTPAAFEKILRHTIEFIRNSSSAKIILPTLGCLSENLARHTNGLQIAFNDIIKRVASDYACGLAEVSDAFDEQLLLSETSDYLQDSYFSTVVTDRLHSTTGKVDELSRKRHLHLTLDGFHLNTKGSEIFQSAVEEQILLAAIAAPTFMIELDELKQAELFFH